MSRSVILCVDDDKLVLSALSEQLVEWFGKTYTIEKALGGEEALAIIDDLRAEGTDISVVISDYIMPTMKGDELLERVNKKDPSIRKIMLTGYAALDGIIYAINRAGLYRFLSKPWDKKDLMLTLLEAIKSYEAEKSAAKLATSFKSLYQEYETQYVSQMQRLESTLQAIVTATDSRNAKTVEHSMRVKDLAVKLAGQLDLTKEDLRVLTLAALSHDIGKQGLTDSELAQLVSSADTEHQNFAERAPISKASINVAKHLPEGDKIVKILEGQFELFNGSGLLKLAGEAIPLGARILSVVNTYDNLSIICGKSEAEVTGYLLSHKGANFDPRVVDVFLGASK